MTGAPLGAPARRRARRVREPLPPGSPRAHAETPDRHAPTPVLSTVEVQTVTEQRHDSRDEVAGVDVDPYSFL